MAFWGVSKARKDLLLLFYGRCRALLSSQYPSVLLRPRCLLFLTLWLSGRVSKIPTEHTVPHLRVPVC